MAGSNALRELQSLFVVCLGELIRYAASKGYALTLGEGFIRNPRKSRAGTRFEDGVHMVGSLHYLGLAQDLNLFIDERYITDGSHEAWKGLGEFWVGLSPLCRWGGHFGSVDSNHFSITFGGKS